MSNINLELVGGSKPIDVFNDLKDFKYDVLGRINDCITMSFDDVLLDGLWMFNNHNQPLCITMVWKIMGKGGNHIKIEIKMFSETAFNTFLYYKRADGSVRATPYEGFPTKTPIETLGLLLKESKRIHEFLDGKLG